MHEECYYCLRRNEIFMLSYHETIRKRGKSIVEDKCIKHDAELLYKDTTLGYIYIVLMIFYTLYIMEIKTLCVTRKNLFMFLDLI